MKVKTVMTGTTESAADGHFHSAGGVAKRHAPGSGFLHDATHGKLLEFANDGKQQLAGTLDGLVQAAHEFADRLEGGAGGPIAAIAQRVADTVSQWQAAIEAKPVEELLDDGRDLVRQSPMLALTVSVAAGFLISRILKSTADAR